MSILDFGISWVNSYSGDPQTSEIFSEIKTLEEGVAQVLELSKVSQEKLIKMLENIKSSFEKSVMIYNPGVKSYESALRKVQNATGEPNQILMLNDGYRASILCKNIDDIPNILSKIDEVLPEYKFEKLVTI